MKIASILENQNVEKRIAITPEIPKKYISLGFEVLLSENYGSHLGIKDEDYKDLPGDYCERVIPDPIPNSEVKPFCANGTLS